MSWFKYGDQSIRRYRKGICLRVRSIPEPLNAQIKALLAPGESVWRVAVDELLKDGRVRLEIWATQPKHRNGEEVDTVFGIVVPEDPSWTCEGDLGRGLVGVK